ncbi:hypothetical protein IJJ08_04670 [bacterium]|nr:hypothetical protein [bacterium]
MLFNVLQFICATYVHNYEVIGFFVAMLAALYALIVKPTRQRVLFFVGFLLLILHFEYYKHINEGLQDQTLATLFLQEPHYRGRWLTRVFIQHVIPLSLWLTAWGSIVLALIKPKWLFADAKKSSHQKLK